MIADIKRARAAWYWTYERHVMLALVLSLLSWFMAETISAVLVGVAVGLSGNIELIGTWQEQLLSLALMFLFLPRSILAVRWLLRRTLPFWLH